MGSLIKLVAGMAIGAGAAVVARRLAERRQMEQTGLYDDPEASTSGFMARMREAGEAAREVRAEREAELQSRFRHRVNDPTAFTSTGPETITE